MKRYAILILVLAGCNAARLPWLEAAPGGGTSTPPTSPMYDKPVPHPDNYLDGCFEHQTEQADIYTSGPKQGQPCFDAAILP